MNKKRLIQKRLFSSAFLQARYILSSIFVLISALIILIISWLKPNAFQTLRTTFIDISAPAIELTQTPLTNVQNMITHVKETLNLRQENHQLRVENEKLIQWYLLSQSLIAENQELRRMENLKNQPYFTNQRTLTTTVLNDTSNDFAQSIIIKAGKQNQILKNAVVIAHNGLVGRVTESADHSARVLLITDINARVPVIIAHNDIYIHAILAGQNNLKPLISHVADAAMIKKLKKAQGAKIITSGTGGIFPYGIPVGTLHINKNGQLTASPYVKKDNLFFIKVLL